MNPSRRRRALTARPLTPPTPAGNRVTLTPDGIRAAYRAHTGHEHAGQVGRACRTCAAYLGGLAAAHHPRQDTP